MLFDIPNKEGSIIKVIGVGGGGGNAVEHMFKQGIVGVDFAICNTDQQALAGSNVDTKIHLGPNLTEGMGAGSKPEVGKQACIESVDEIRKFLEQGTKMVFITAGMGGGTGTGAAPIIAKVARELDILTVGIVTLPFKFEGLKRRRFAAEGIEQLKKHVDALLVISNEKLKQMFGNMQLSDAFGQADNILATAAKGIAEIITVPGKINVDFEDVNTVMRNSGVAIMGSASASGEDRARFAVNQALNSPLLEENDIRGAQHILLNITSGSEEVTMDEIGEITEYIEEEAGYGTNVIWGHCRDESLNEKLCITLIATGFTEGAKEKKVVKEKVVRVPLSENELNQITDFEDYAESKEAINFDFTEDEEIEVSFDSSEKENTTKEAVGEQLSAFDKESYLKETEAEIVRRKYFMEMNAKSLDDPNAINDLESQPAYLRRNVELENIQDSKVASTLSDLAVGIDADAPISESKNSFLHDNVD